MLQKTRSFLVGRLLCALAGIVLAVALRAELDPAFAADFGIPADVRAVGEAADGSVYLGGEFDRIGPVARRHLARLSPSGEVDPAFDVGEGFFVPSNPSVRIRRLRVLADGNLFVAGDFTFLRDDLAPYAAIVSPSGSLVRRFPQSRPDLVPLRFFALESGRFLVCDSAGPDLYPLTRLLADGTVDPSFQSTLKYAEAATEYPDGRLLVSTRLGSLSTVRRLLPGGSADPTFTPFETREIAAIVLQPDGGILLGGAPQGGIVRLLDSGALDEAFLTARGPGFGESSFLPVSCLALQASGHILVGGDFTLFSGVTRRGLARLTPAGALDAATFLPAGTVRALGRSSGVLAGNFRELAGARASSVGRLETESTVDTGFRPLVTSASATGGLEVAPDGAIFVAGNFVSVRGQSARTLVRFDASGQVDPAFVAPESLGTVFGQLPLADGRILVTGRPFEGGDYLVRLLPSGAVDTTFVPPPGLTVSLARIAVSPTGEIAAHATLPDGFSTRLVRLRPDGALDFVFPFLVTTGTPQLLYARDGSRLYAFGSGYSARLEDSSSTFSAGVSTVGVAAFLPNGQIDPTFRAAVDGAESLTEAPDGSLYVCGSLLSASNPLPPFATRTKVVRLSRSGRIDESFQIGGGLLSGYMVALGSPTRIYLAGDLPNADSLARLRPTGVFDPSYQSGLGDENAPFQIRWQPDGGLAVALSRPLRLVRVRPESGAPTVSSAPAVVRRAAGRPVALGIGAGGALPMTSAWTRNGAPFAPASDDLLATAMTPALAGDYQVTFTNGAGSASSSVTRLELNGLPEITSLPDGVFSQRSGMQVGARVSDDATPAAALRVSIDYRSADCTLVAPRSFDLTPNAQGEFGLSLAEPTVLLGPTPRVTFFVRVYDQDDGVTSRSFQLEVRSEVFADWAARSFTLAELANPAVSGRAADLTGTGLSNLAAYYWDANPRDPLSPRRPVVQRDANGALEVLYYDLVPPAGTGQIVEFSVDLQNWVANGPDVQTQVLGTTPEGRRRRLSSKFVGANSGRIFTRFRFSNL